MTDREKVVHGLEDTIGFLTIAQLRFMVNGNGDPNTIKNCIASCEYALALLNERDSGIEPIKSTVEQKKNADKIGIIIPEFWCGACHFNLIGCPKFCPNCGKRIKWISKEEDDA